MPDDTVIISNLPSHSPSGSDYLAVENDSLTGKATVNDVVGASSSVATLNSKIKFTEYTNVTQLGLTSGSATVVAVYSAMATPGRFVGSNDQFASGDVPSGNGTVVIERLSTARGYVWFYGKGSTPGDYRMFLGARAYNGNDSNLPTGEWIAEPTRAEITALNSKIGLNAHNEKNLGTSYGMVNFSGLTYNNNTNAFARTSDGGVLCKKAGVVSVHAMVRMYGLNTGDTVGINVSIYRSGSWPYESYASTVYSGAVATAVLMQTVSVQANDVLYICAANLTASRGKVSSGGTMWAEYV